MHRVSFIFIGLSLNSEVICVKYFRSGRKVCIFLRIYSIEVGKRKKIRNCTE